jgi:KaiC/GvpD/RAD55 family RecA-like ATPase
VEQQETYGFDPAFEAILVTLLCSKQRAFDRIGSFVDPAKLERPECQLAMKAAVAFSVDKGHGPSNLTIVAQRLRAWWKTGKVTIEQINAVNDMFDAVIDAGMPADEDVIEEAVPVLKYDEEKKAVRIAIDAHGKRDTLAPVADLIMKADRIGHGTTSLGILLNEEAFAEIEALSLIKRLTTGIPELDNALEGGIEYGTLTILMGGPGDGKSMGLMQIAAESALHQMNVAYATLELSRARTAARFISNLTGIRTHGVMNGSMSKAKARLKSLASKLGTLRVEYFTPNQTTIEDIKEWVKRLEQETGEPVHVVVVDYGDKLTVKGKTKKGDYLDMREVFEGFRIWMEETGKVGFTASQAKRRDKNGSKLLGVDDGADSQHKARVCDQLITLNVQDNGANIVFHIAKARNGAGRTIVGPLQTDWACARIAPVNREHFCVSETFGNPQRETFEGREAQKQEELW